jgi:hypothetical protein
MIQIASLKANSTVIVQSWLSIKWVRYACGPETDCHWILKFQVIHGAVKDLGLRSTILDGGVVALDDRFAQPISEKTGFAVQYVIDSANGNRPITNDETQKILDALTGLD